MTPRRRETRLQYNGLQVMADEMGTIATRRSLDGGFHFFHVCCGCHKVHEAHVHIRDDGQILEHRWDLPLPDESMKIKSALPPALETDLIVFERANFNAAKELDDARAEIATLRGQLKTIAGHVLDAGGATSGEYDDGVSVAREVAETFATLREHLKAVCDAGVEAIGYPHVKHGVIDRSRPCAQYSDDGPDAWPAQLVAAIAAAIRGQHD